MRYIGIYIIVKELEGEWKIQEFKEHVVATKGLDLSKAEVHLKLHRAVPYLYFSSSRYYYSTEAAIDASLNHPIPLPADLKDTSKIYEYFPPLTPYMPHQIDNLKSILQKGFYVDDVFIRYDGNWHVGETCYNPVTFYCIYSNDLRLRMMILTVSVILVKPELKYMMTPLILENYGYEYTKNPKTNEPNGVRRVLQLESSASQ
jgi:hypothetical protein